MADGYTTIRYDVGEGVAFVTLNRPDRLNTIVPPMPEEFADAIRQATLDNDVGAVVVRGAGRAFCAGYDFGGGFHHWDAALNTDGRWDPGKDFVFATAPGVAPTQQFMAMWYCPKPVIAQIHGFTVGGGSDMALCADLVIAADDTVIGTPYARMCGCYLSGMWIYRLRLTKVKELAHTGRSLHAAEAVDVGLINRAVPFARLEDEVRATARAMLRIPASQHAAMKMIVNQAIEAMGLHHTQRLGPILDGLMRNTPDALRFVEIAAGQGVQAAIEWRDAPWGDYSRAPAEQRPNPAHVVAADPFAGNASSGQDDR